MRRFNIEENVILRLELYKNRHEKIAEIPLNFVENIKYKFNDIDEISITIPQYVSDNGRKLLNRLHRNVNTRQIVIVTTTNADGTSKQQKFTLANKKSIGRKNVGSKSFVAYSWEKTLERDRITVDALARQLTNKGDDVHIGEGILDLICAKTGWKVGYVDPKARTKINLNVQTFSNNLFNNLTVNKVTDGMLLFDKDITINVSNDKPLYLNFHYTNVKVYDENNNVLSTMNILNDLGSEPLYTSLKNIKAYRYSEAGNRYGIRYVLTMVDNVQVERVCVFTNCINKKMTIDAINMSHDFGDIVEEENIQYANFEAFDDSAYKFLQDVQNVFDCIFEYNTMDKIINVYACENLNKNSSYPLTLGENVIEINTSEDESIPTMLKVDSENTSIIENNPNGTQFIENYDYYIKNGLMSDSLLNALSEYDRIAINLMEQWDVLQRSKTLLSQKYVKAESEVKSLTERIKNLTNLLSSYFNTDNPRQQEIKEEIEQLEVRMAELLGQMSGYKTEMDLLDEQIIAINSQTQKANMTNEQGAKVFSENDLLELSDIKECVELSDSYYTTSYGLYNYAKKYLEDKANPKIDFSLSCVDLINVIQNPIGWNNILTLGSLFPVEENEILNEKEIRLTEMEVIPCGGDKVKANSFKFSNKILKFSSTASNIGKTTNKVVGKMTDFGSVWEDSKMSNNFVSEMRTKGLNLAATNISSLSYKNKLDFTEAGMFVIDATNEDNQLYMGSSIIAFSNDKFKTCKTALDQNGLIAKTLIGEIILGNQLIIQSDDGLFYVGNSEGTKNFGINIYDSLNEGRQKRIFLGLEETNGVKKAVLRLFSKDGKTLLLSEDGMVSTEQMCGIDDLDSSHPMEIDIYVDEGVQSFSKAILKLRCKKFRSTTRGGRLVSKASIIPSGGGSTSGGGGGGTSTVAGSHAHQIFGDMGDVQAPFYDTVLRVANGGYIQAKVSQAPGAGSYSSIGVDNHFHYSDYHFHGTPNHTHPAIDLSHQHDEEWGISEDTIASNLKIYVNGIKIAEGINGDSEIDISSNLKINQWNTIKIESFTNGRVSWNIFTKSWNLF